MKIRVEVLGKTMQIKFLVTSLMNSEKRDNTMFGKQNINSGSVRPATTGIIGFLPCMSFSER